jgi:hypothetical protein
MLKRITGIIVAAGLLASCQKAHVLTYNSPDNIYFNYSDPTFATDSVVYTFAFSPGQLSDTLLLPVRISGNRVAKDRKYQLVIIDSGTTAVVKEHYAPFLDYYIIPADSGTAWLPIILYNTDTLLTKRSVSLEVQLVGTSDLGTAIADMIDARIIISNKLEEPIWWTLWLGSYFSQVKYQLFIIATGINTLSTSGLDAPKNLYFVGLLNNLLQDPFGWVSNNPQSGYVLQQQAGGSYYFFKTGNPADFIVVQKDPSTGTYFFIDENGGEVN